MRVAALLLAFLWATNVAAAEPTFPALTGRVVDQAQILSPAAEAKLGQRLAAHETATGQQIVVATVSSLQGQSIEDFGYKLGRAWGIGEKGKNTGAIILVAPNEHEVRIEVGYGLEGTLTDALSRRIIERDILPEFRAGRMESGVFRGTLGVLAALGSGTAPEPRADSAAPNRDTDAFSPFVLVVVFLVFLYLSRRRRGFLPGIFLGGPTIWRSGGSGNFFRGGGGSFGGGGASGRW